MTAHLPFAGGPTGRQCQEDGQAWPCNAELDRLRAEKTPVVLTKTRRLLDYFGRDRHETALFRNPEEGSDAHLFPLAQETYDDMGRPEQITVTIEPGDRLNLKDEQ